jgi:hypothetical protein
MINDYSQVVTRRRKDILEEIHKGAKANGWIAKEVIITREGASVLVESFFTGASARLSSTVSARMVIEATKEFIEFLSPADLVTTIIREQAAKHCLRNIEIPEEFWKTEFPMYHLSQELIDTYVLNPERTGDKEGLHIEINAILKPGSALEVVVSRKVADHAYYDLGLLQECLEKFPEKPERPSLTELFWGKPLEHDVAETLRTVTNLLRTEDKHTGWPHCVFGTRD